MVVPYLHITTRIEGRAHEGLFREKGGTGFPTIMFLSSKGQILQKRFGRSTRDFLGALEKVKEFQVLQAKASKGDSKAAGAVLLRQLRLEWFDFDEASERAGQLKKVSKSMQREIDQLLVETEVRTQVKTAGRDQQVMAGKHFASMFENKRIPQTDAQQHNYWVYMALYAADQKDKKLFNRIIKEYNKLPNSSKKRRGLKDLEARYARL